MKNKLILSCMVAVLGAFSANAAPKFQNVHLILGNEAIEGKVTLIKNSQRWTADTVYIIDRLTFVEAPAVLTIEPGTIVRMEQKTTGGSSVTDPADVGTLIICRGATIVANGTAESPIIFTNIDDPFVPGGEITIPNYNNGVTNNSVYAPWSIGSFTKRSYAGNDRFNHDATCGGLIILGRTPVAFGNPGQSGSLSFQITNGGEGYESAPSVTVSAGNAVATNAAISTVGQVNKVVNFTTRGVYNSSNTATVSFTAGSSDTISPVAGGTASMRAISGAVSSLALEAGSGYTNVPTLTFSEPPSGGEKATATVSTNSTGGIAAVVIQGGRGYTSAPTVTIQAAPAGKTNAVATAFIGGNDGKFEISTVTLTNRGNGYSTATAVFTALDQVTQARATGTLGRKVVAINVANPGSNYSNAPTVTIAAPPTNVGGSTALATATLTGGFANPTAVPTATTGIGANFIEGFQTIDGTLLGTSQAVGGTTYNFSGSIYGGSNDDDNSGTLRFVSIRYGGFVLSPNNEINGLTCGAVGRSTCFEFIEVVNNADDDIEHFAGSVDMKYVAGLFGGDDGIDIDQGYRGRIQFACQIQNNTSGTSRPTGNIGDCLGEWDGGELPTTSRPYTVHTLFNFTGIGTGSAASAGKGINYKENSGGKVFNSIFADARTGIVLESNSVTYTLTNGISSPEDGSTSGHRFAFTRTNGGVYNLIGVTGSAGEPDAMVKYTTFMKIGSNTNSNNLNTSILSGINTNAGAYGDVLINSNNNTYTTVTTNDIRGIARVATNGLLDPRLTTTSTLRTNGVLPSASGGVRASDTFYTQTKLRGAFGDCNWLSGWSLLSEWGLLSDANVAIPAVKLTRASGVLTVSFTPTSGVEYVIETSADGKKFTPVRTVTGGASDVSEALPAGTANSLLFVRVMPL